MGIYYIHAQLFLIQLCKKVIKKTYIYKKKIQYNIAMQKSMTNRLRKIEITECTQEIWDETMKMT